jgi:hypothetical protein
MKHRGRCMALVDWLGLGGERRVCKHGKLCEEWRICRGGDGLVAVVLRRKEIPKYDIRGLDVETVVR